MTDLISREALIKELETFDEEFEPQIDEVYALITNAPAIEQGELVKKAVADVLEEVDNIKVNYTKSGRDDALTKIVEDVIQEAVESTISQYKEAIRALIKRDAEGVE